MVAIFHWPGLTLAAPILTTGRWTVGGIVVALVLGLVGGAIVEATRQPTPPRPR